MRQIKLVGRELAVVRAIESVGSSGEYLHERTGIDYAELLDTLNALYETGYVEAYPDGGQVPAMEPLEMPQLQNARFEINPAYYLELKKVMLRR
jgi:hypothetical protein